MIPDYDRWTGDGYNSDDPAIRAVARGRALTSSLAHLVAENDRGAFWIDIRSVLRGGPVLYAANSEDSFIPADKQGQPLEGTVKWSDPKTALAHVYAMHTPSFGVDRPLRGGYRGRFTGRKAVR